MNKLQEYVWGSISVAIQTALVPTLVVANALQHAAQWTHDMSYNARRKHHLNRMRRK